MNNYVATLYEKVKLGENVYTFKRIDYIEKANINFNDEFFELSYYDNGKKITLLPMDCPYFVISDDKYCYGYPMDYEMLNYNYPDINDKEILFKKYKEEISKVFDIAYFNEDDDSLKILETNEEVFKKTDDIEIFSDFSLSYDSKQEERCSISVKDIGKMLDYIKNKKYDHLELILKDVNEKILETNNIINNFFGISINNNDNKIIEQERDNHDINFLLQKLKELIGIEEVKKEVNKLAKYLIFREKTKENLKLENPNLHMIFTGNPGTGKTTVAKIISKILYKMGYVNDKFVETTPKDFIGEYVGHTAEKASRIIKKYKGGVIFVDEAYAFASEGANFSDEALAEILVEMAKNETVFIFAGYKKEMERFIKINSGLTSRIGYYIDYKDYTVDQLLQIFSLKVNKMGFTVEEGLKEKIKLLLEKELNVKNFGNGRYIDKLINKVILEHSINTEDSENIEELKTLKEIDFNDDLNDSLTYKTKTKKIGF